MSGWRMCHDGFSNAMSFPHWALDTDMLHLCSLVCFKWKRTWIWTNFTRCWLQVISMIRKSDYLRDKNPVCIPIGQTVSMVAEWYLKIQLKKRGLKIREQLICCIPSLDMLDKNGVPGCGGDTSRWFCCWILPNSPSPQIKLFLKGLPSPYMLQVASFLMLLASKAFKYPPEIYQHILRFMQGEPQGTQLHHLRRWLTSMHLHINCENKNNICFGCVLPGHFTP